MLGGCGSPGDAAGGRGCSWEMSWRSSQLPEVDLCCVRIQGLWFGHRVLGIIWSIWWPREQDMTWNFGSQVCLSVCLVLGDSLRS